MLLKRSLITITICSVVAGVSHAQTVPAADSTAQKETGQEAQKQLSEEEQKKAQELEKEALKKAEQQRRQEQARKTKPPKEVFKPTEEISEDSPVPFPVDI